MITDSNNELRTSSLPEPLLTGNEVARILKISRSFAYTLLKRGEIPSVHIGRSVRVRPADLEAWIQNSIQHSEA